jgi:hypothetical protein
VQMISKKDGEKWTVHLVDTGLNTMTGDRMKLKVCSLILL